MIRRLSLIPLAMLVWALAAALPAGQSGATSAPRAGSVTIAGSVVDAALAPVAGVALTLEQSGRVVARATTDGAGTFRFANVAPGDYRVRAEHSGFPTLTRDLHVPVGAPMVQLPLVMSRPGDAMADAKAIEREATGQAGSRPAARPVPAPAPAPMPVAPPAVMSGIVAGGSGGRGGGYAGQPATLPDASAQVWNPGRPYRDDRDEPWSGYRYTHGGERYAHVPPNQFESAYAQPLSTFGADVDTASYSNVRRFLSAGQLPPRDAVRVEEFVNYFRVDYPEPRGNRPIGLTTEIADCPWAPAHKLVLIGAKARTQSTREVEARNIVLLIDVSGSMAPAERLPLIKSALAMFVDTLRADDRLAIVTYAGSSGVALPSTPARERDVIQRAIAGLSAGGSTNGGQGLIMAYRVARESFVPGGVNRVILATDGDFNVGVVSQRDLVQLIEREKDSGVFLSVFGVGSGNLKDSTMEMLADRGNGHYAYLDSLQEARRVLVREGDATLETVAKDVKFQVEFNPAMVGAWKLIGYENRVMAARDFNDDRKDGGEMGAGHTVTALYEIVPAGSDNLRDDVRDGRPEVDPLKYRVDAQVVLPPSSTSSPRASDASASGEWLTVKARYKAPEGDVSDLIVQPVRTSASAQYLPLASAVAEFGLLVRSGSTDARAWDALTRRAARLQVPGRLVADVDGFRELVAIASGLTRIR